MIKQSLGLIETVGLSAAIEAADTAVKSANVTLVGYELTKGGGMVVVKLLGEVGAVNAAIDAARISAAKVSQVYATKIIARIGDGLDVMLKQQDTAKQEIPSTVNDAVIEPAQTVVDGSNNTNIDTQSIDVKVLPEHDEIGSDQGCMFNQDIVVETQQAADKKDQASESKSTNKKVQSNTLVKKKK